MLSLNRINTDQEYAKKVGFKQGRTFDKEEVGHKVSLGLKGDKIIERTSKRFRDPKYWVYL